MKKGILGATLVVASLSTAHADVTVSTTTAGKVMIMNLGGNGSTAIKGNRMRSESTVGGRATSLVIDIDGRRFIDIDDNKKSATITPLDAIADELGKVGVGSLSATLRKTGQTKSIAGYSCSVHDVNVSLPFSPTGHSGDGMDLTMVLAGTVCLSTDVPGLKDYQAFYRASADSGFIFGDPRTVKSPTGAAQARAYAELTRKMAEAGMALESHVNISATGSGPMAAMMGKLAAGEITTTVTKVETGDVAGDRFDVPAGYKVKTQK